MKFLKNRTVLGVICIALALIICFAITPLFNASKSSTMKIVRIKNDLKIGQEITSKDIEVVEVGAYNMPSHSSKKPTAKRARKSSLTTVNAPCSERSRRTPRLPRRCHKTSASRPFSAERLHVQRAMVVLTVSFR